MTTRNHRIGIIPSVVLALCFASVPLRAAEPAPTTTSPAAATPSKGDAASTPAAGASKGKGTGTTHDAAPEATPSAKGASPVGEKEAGTHANKAATPAASEEGTVAAARAALATGDWTAAKVAAQSARERNPSDPEAWWVEGEVLEKSGDHTAAVAAYREGLKLAPTHPRAAEIGARIDAIETRARGTVVDEPDSTHRSALDQRRQGTQPAPAQPAVPRVAQVPTPIDKPESIVKKWYFWVTLAVIAGSAAAVTALSIKAAMDEQDDALDASAGAPRDGVSSPFVIRF